jgi:hypothetical protein
MEHGTAIRAACRLGWFAFALIAIVNGFLQELIAPDEIETGWVLGHGDLLCLVIAWGDLVAILSPAAIHLVALAISIARKTFEITFGVLDGVNQFDLVHMIGFDAT